MKYVLLGTLSTDWASIETAAPHLDLAAWKGPRGAAEPISRCNRVREDDRSASAERQAPVGSTLPLGEEDGGNAYRAR